MDKKTIRDHPAVSKLMDSTGISMNSDSFLLSFSSELYKGETDSFSILQVLLSSKEFADEMFENDFLNEWESSYSCNYDDEGSPTYKRRQVDWLVHDAKLKINDVVREEVVHRLNWFLTGAFSPYNKHLKPDMARRVVEDFMVTIEGNDCCWRFCFIEPTFLRSTGYWDMGSGDDYVQHDLTYFDGAGSDTVTLFIGNKSALMLLTNGSP